MDLGYSDTEQLLVETIARIFAEAANPSEPYSGKHALKALFGNLGAAALLGVDVPVHLGGSGGTALDAAIIGLAAGRSSITRTIPVLPLSECWQALWLAAQARDPDLLEVLQSGDQLGVVLAEGFDAAGSGVSGRSLVVPFGDLADIFIVRTLSGVVKVHACDAHVEPQPATGPMDIATVTLEATSVTPLNLTDPGYAWSVAVMRSRIVRAAMAVGAAETALAYAVEYVKQRNQFGRAIGSFQAVQHRLADCATQVEQARLLVFRAASDLVGEESHDIDSLIAAMLSLAIAAYESVATTACQVLGGYGFTMDYDAQAHLRLAKSWSLLDSAQWWEIGDKALRMESAFARS